MRIAFSIVMIFSLDIDESNKEVNVSGIWPVLLNLYCVVFRLYILVPKFDKNNRNVKI